MWIQGGALVPILAGLKILASACPGKTSDRPGRTQAHVPLARLYALAEDPPQGFPSARTAPGRHRSGNAAAWRSRDHRAMVGSIAIMPRNRG